MADCESQDSEEMEERGEGWSVVSRKCKDRDVGCGSSKSEEEGSRKEAREDSHEDFPVFVKFKNRGDGPTRLNPFKCSPTTKDAGGCVHWQADHYWLCVVRRSNVARFGDEKFGSLACRVLCPWREEGCER